MKVLQEQNHKRALDDIMDLCVAADLSLGGGLALNKEEDKWLSEARDLIDKIDKSLRNREPNQI